MTASATARLSRLLAMVPWLLRRQGVPLADAAAHFQITEKQLVKDLELLFVCGTPGHFPDDLIEADWESGQVYLGNADQIARPLRLGVDEAVALLVGLRTLAAVPGLHDRDVIDSVLATLSAAAGEATAAADALAVDWGGGAEEAALSTIRSAQERRRRLRLRYLVPSRDEISERDVDPVRLVTRQGHWYLEGWCHRAEAMRSFRLDRLESVEVLDVAATPPEEAVTTDLSEDAFAPSDDAPRITLLLEPHGRWVSEYYPVESVTEHADGRMTVALPAVDPGWVVQLVLRLGGAGRVLDPPEVADIVRIRARAALDAYR
jgi:predicted DNA-binding transcriptional regulator YafY